MIQDLLGSLLVSGLGAAMTVVLPRLWRLARLWRLQRLCSIDGTFVTEYELADGSQLMKRAVTQLTQRGTRVRGITTELDSTRSWQLDGEIDRSGFLRCTYRGSDDEGTGQTLLLAIERGGHALSGLWSRCYDGDRRVSSGRYLMRRAERARQ